MHESSITESILSLAMDKAVEAKAQKITRINLVLGELSGIVGECVQQYFEILAKDSIAENAVLSFTKKPTLLKCRKCAKEFSPPGQDWACPACRDLSVEIISGRECYMESIEVD
jgi:hydrogenase nickel incorporation protein HypA/HybF